MNNVLQQMREFKFNENQNLIWECYHKMNIYESNGQTKDDYFQIGAMGLIKAIDTYDMRKGMQFSTYACKCIMNELGMNIRSSQSSNKVINNLAISIDTPVGEDENTTVVDYVADTTANKGFDNIGNPNIAQAITKAMSTFTPQEAEFFQARFFDALETDVSNREFVTNKMEITVGEYKSLDRKVRIKMAQALGVKYDPKFKNKGGIVESLLK